MRERNSQSRNIFSCSMLEESIGKDWDYAEK
jgi:hypothetical protein